jgi:hypothetical protein
MKINLLVAAGVATFALSTVSFGQAQLSSPETSAPETSTTTPISTSSPDPEPLMDDDSALNPYKRPEPKVRFKRFINSTVGPVTIAKNLGTAGIGTARNSPEEWGGQWEGFGRRFGSSMAKGAIKNGVMFGLDEAMKLDSGFYPSRDRSAGAKLKNALISPFTARTESGKRVIGLPRIAGSFTSGVIASTTWYPERYGVKDGLRSGAISLGFNAAFNVIKEFVWKK